jgi:hypothetical protein
MTAPALTLAADSTEPLTCGRCHASGVPRLIRPYWTPPGGRRLCPSCCDAASHHYEAVPDGWPPHPDTGLRPAKLADLQAFWSRHRRFPTDAERNPDGTLLEPPEPDAEETPEW